MTTEYLQLFIDNSGFKGYKIEHIRGAGSDRSFHRLTKESSSVVMMSGGGHGGSIEDWVEVQRFLHSLGFGVPKIFAYDIAIPAAIVEDLGECRPPELYEYELVVRELARLAVIAGENISKCPTVANRPFDFEAFRWESTYFTEQYLRGYRKLDESLINRLSEDFDRIAKYLSNLPKYFTHRDFQSTNVLLVDKCVRIIDFQSAHFGPAEYDLASMLWDPYADIPADARVRLVESYLDEFEGQAGKIDRKLFMENLETAAISRLMQALGAFCFLSAIKGKLMFCAFISPAEKRLRGLLARNDFLRGLQI